jgi:hypothetical protein
MFKICVHSFERGQTYIYKQIQVKFFNKNLTLFLKIICKVLKTNKLENVKIILIYVKF